jgi:hypothetical protein
LRGEHYGGGFRTWEECLRRHGYDLVTNSRGVVGAPINCDNAARLMSDGPGGPGLNSLSSNQEVHLRVDVEVLTALGVGLALR